jgi:protocatechuate 3,4-dioxygenase beta subunit
MASLIYDRLDPETQLRSQIEGYQRSILRTPGKPLIVRPPTLTERTGPLAIERRLPVTSSELHRRTPEGQRAAGQLMELLVEIVDEDGTPIPNVLVELWHANASGKYDHRNDLSAIPLDPNFLGKGRVLTDDSGSFRLTTIKPGAYPADLDQGFWRAPHIHFSVISRSWMQRLVTQMFFPGDPLNAMDLLLTNIPDLGARERVTALMKPPTKDGRLSFTHRIVVRGRNATPQL